MATIRERVLAFGPPGSSKSYQWLRLARWLKKKDAQFYVIDTEDAIPRMLQEEFPDLDADNGGNVHVYPVFDWPDYMGAQQEIRKLAEEGDWIIIDMADEPWKAVQNYFINEVFQKDIADYFLEARKQLAARGDKTDKGKTAKNLQVMKGWLDWPVINKIYDSFMLPLIYQTKAHLYMTAKANSVSSDDDKGTREIYGSFGVRPAGQKNLAHQVHTEFLFQLGSDFESWEITTVKDRGRKYFDHRSLLDLAKQYYMQVVKW